MRTTQEQILEAAPYKTVTYYSYTVTYLQSHKPSKLTNNTQDTSGEKRMISEVTLFYGILRNDAPVFPDQ